jgi:hypothetical protein
LGNWWGQKIIKYDAIVDQWEPRADLPIQEASDRTTDVMQELMSIHPTPLLRCQGRLVYPTVMILKFDPVDPADLPILSFRLLKWQKNAPDVCLNISLCETMQ